MMFTKKLSKVLLLTTFIYFIPSTSMSAPASQSDLAKSALESAVGSSDIKDVEEIISKNKTTLLNRITSDEGKEVSATLVFKSGMSAKDLVDYSEKYALEIIRTEAKVAEGDTGLIRTMSVGARDLLMPSGNLYERILKSSGVQYMELLSEAQSKKSAEEEMKKVIDILPKIKYYTIEIIGEMGDLRGLMDDSETAALLIDFDDITPRKSNYRFTQEAVAKTRTDSTTITWVLGQNSPVDINSENTIYLGPRIDTSNLPPGMTNINGLKPGTIIENINSEETE